MGLKEIQKLSRYSYGAVARKIDRKEKGRMDVVGVERCLMICCVAVVPASLPLLVQLETRSWLALLAAQC